MSRVSSLSHWIGAMRPKTLFAGVCPVLLGGFLAIRDGLFHGPTFYLVMVCALLIQIGTNLANDYFDFKHGADTAARLGPVRATSAGLISPTAMKWAFCAAFGVAFLVGLLLVVRGGWVILGIGILSILFGILYTGGPYPLGYNGLGDVFVLLFFGPVAVGGTYYLLTLTGSWESVLIGVSSGLFSMAILAVNNLRDMDEDTQSGKRTLAVRFGAGFAKWEYAVAIVAGSAIPVVSALVFSTSLKVGITLFTIPAAVSALRAVWTQRGRVLNDVLARTGQLLLMFTVLFGIGLL